MAQSIRHHLVARIALLIVALVLPFSSRQCVAFDDVPIASGEPIGDLYLEPPVDGFTALPAGLNEVPATSFAEPSPSGRTYLEGRPDNERLIDKVTDPTSYLMDLRYRHQWNWPVQDDPNSQALQIRPTIPFRAWGQVNLLRVTVPYDIEGSGAPGLGDLQILDLIVFQESWGRWAVGPSLQMTPHSASGDGTFQAGPAAGAVTKNKHWSVGFLTQNYFADGVAQSRIQPILSHKFNDRWALGIGDSEFRYDWEDATWTQLPLGVELDYIADVYGQKIQFFANPQYNFQRGDSNSGWTIFIGLTFLMPEA